MKDNKEENMFVRELSDDELENVSGGAWANDATGAFAASLVEQALKNHPDQAQSISLDVSMMAASLEHDYKASDLVKLFEDNQWISADEKEKILGIIDSNKDLL